MTKEISEVKSIIRNDNDKELHRLLVENYLDVNMTLAIENGPDHNLLTMACTMGSIKCIKLLLDNGADINKFINIFSNNREKDKFLAIFCRACASGSTDLLRFLIDRGVKLDDSILFRCFDSVEQSSLQADKRQAIAALLVQSISNVALKEYGFTLLHRVCSIGGINNVKAVLERGVDRDAISGSFYGHSGRDALCTAAANGHLDIVKLLLEWDKHRPIHMSRVNIAMIEAAKYSKLEVVQCLTEYGADNQTVALIAAVSYTWSLALSEYLLDSGSDVNGKVDGDTPLLALLSNTRTGDKPKLQIARLLLARGADRDAKACLTRRSGYDSLILAAKYGLPDFLQLILDHIQGQPITINRLNEALLLSLGRSVGVTRCLLDHGAELDTIGSGGCTLLLLLCIKHSFGRMSEKYFDDYLPTVHLLLERGADVSKVSPASGNTALLYACECDVIIGLAVSTMLLDHGADVNQGNATTGETLLMRAALYKHTALVELYLQYGADVMQVNSQGRTVLDLMGTDPEFAMYVELCLMYMDTKPLLK